MKDGGLSRRLSASLCEVELARVRAELGQPSSSPTAGPAARAKPWPGMKRLTRPVFKAVRGGWRRLAKATRRPRQAAAVPQLKASLVKRSLDQLGCRLATLEQRREQPAGREVETMRVELVDTRRQLAGLAARLSESEAEAVRCRARVAALEAQARPVHGPAEWRGQIEQRAAVESPGEPAEWSPVACNDYCDESAAAGLGPG